ncbi:hypothetical protein TNIN_167881 [Trichonephila inaurata madagascariensis]|uniref:Uncharacterized protein n=1 Tax=Trichonephila inaurata madagascariensis TaxID=2747483 RepID=A0A8X6XCW3_9ARAC|nr:hypothetical protein TNIN_167881 [Trichonephila inaurata madagascariensis]
MNEIKEWKGSEESTLLRYFAITRYVLLKSLAVYNDSSKLDFLPQELEHDEHFDVARAVQNLQHIFHADFDKILKSGDGTSIDPEIEYAQFLLSRCKLFCLEPTYSSFLLVSAFLNHASVKKYRMLPNSVHH